MSVTEFRTSAPRRVPSSPQYRSSRSTTGVSRQAVVAAGVGALLCSSIVAATTFGDLERDGAITLVVFVVAIWMWIFAPLADTYIALVAALALVVAGPLSADTFISTLGTSVIWLLIGAFILAAALTASGLPARFAARLLVLARTPRQLVHLVTVALVVTALAIPSTSGRAALALPVFLALAAVLSDRPRLILALAVLFPSVILFSAIGSLLGAGAHLITNEIVRTATGEDFGFLQWMVLGLPLAVVWSHLAAELALTVFTNREERARRVHVPVSAFGEHAFGHLTTPQKRMLVVLVVVVALWCTEKWHGIDPAVIAVLGALTATAPRIGATSLPEAMKSVPWMLLLFMAATVCLGIAVNTSGAAQWLAELVFEPVGSLGSAGATVFLVVVVVGSVSLHLMIQSRSARSAVLVPILVATAPTVGVAPMAAAFVATAAAGYCHTLTSSAKPVALFAASDDVPGYRTEHLLRYSASIAPISIAVLLVFTLWIWPAMGLPVAT